MLLSFGEVVALYNQYVIRAHFGFVYGLPLVYLIVNTSYKLLSQTAILRYYALCCKNQNDKDRRALSVGDVEREAYTDSEEAAPLLTAASDLGGRY